MQTINKLIIFVLTSLALAASAYAQSPREREQLQKMVEQLQKTHDSAGMVPYGKIHIGLIRNSIKLARQIKPTPVTPAEAQRAAGKGMYMFRQATTTKDFVLAAGQFNLAITLAPWVAEYHFNLALAYERAGQVSNARFSLENYLLADPNATDTNAVNSKIGELQAAEDGRENRAWNRLQGSVNTKFVESLDGKRWSCAKLDEENLIFEMRQGVLYSTFGKTPFSKLAQVRGKEFPGWGTWISKMNSDVCYEQKSQHLCGPNGWFSEDMTVITIPHSISVPGDGIASGLLKCCAEFSCLLDR